MKRCFNKNDGQYGVLDFSWHTNSLKAIDVSNGTTNSGWIYSELLMSKLLRRLDPIRKSMNFALNESIRHGRLSVEYDADITHLTMISLNDFINATRDGKYF